MSEATEREKDICRDIYWAEEDGDGVEEAVAILRKYAAEVRAEERAKCVAMLDGIRSEIERSARSNSTLIQEVIYAILGNKESQDEVAALLKDGE